MMTFDDLFLGEDNDSHSRDDDLKNTKQNQLFKDTMDLFKRKMFKAQDLLKQMNLKEKEYDDLNAELHELKVDREKLFNKYNSASEKLTRLELSNKNYEKSCNDYKNDSNKQKLELDGKRKHIEQLEFKIKEMEKDSYHLKDEIKKLQMENKISKSVAKKATKNQACQTNCSQQRDVSVNTNFNQAPPKPLMSSKNTMTDEICSGMDESITMLCSKCDKHVEVPPLKQILKIMSTPPPPSLTNLFSPPCSPRSIQSKQSESIASNAFEPCCNDKFDPIIFEKRIVEKAPNTEYHGPSFMLLDKLTRKMNNLERLIKKKKKNHQKADNCCNQNCSSSKNIQFVVQLPNEKKLFESAKQKLRKQPRVKRLRKKQFSLENKKQLEITGWQVENDIGTQRVESNLHNVMNQLAQKNTNRTCLKNTEIKESSPILPLNSISSNPVKIDSCTARNMVTQTESLSILGTGMNEMIEPVVNKDMVNEDDNNPKHNEKSSVNSPVLVLPNSHENIAKNEQSMDYHSGTVSERTYNKNILIPDVLTKTVKSVNISHQSTESCDDLVLCHKGLNLAIINRTCRSTGEKEDNLGATTSKINSQPKSQEESEGTETQLDARSSIKSFASTDNDKLPSTACSMRAKHSQVGISKPESMQSSFRKTVPAKKTNASKNIKNQFSSAIDEIEAVNSPRNRRDYFRISARKQASKLEEIFGTEDENERSSDESMPESMQSSFRKTVPAKKTNASQNIKNQFSSAIDEIEAVNLPRNRRGNIRMSARKQASTLEEIFETEDENERSSDESFNFRCSTTIGKRRKTSHVIESGDSGDENLEKIDKNNYRKNLLEKRKKLLSKIRNLKKNSKNLATAVLPVKQSSDSSNDVTPTVNLPTSSVPEKKVAELNNDTILSHINNPVPMKQRVAHIPKDAGGVKEMELKKDSLPSDTCIIQKTGCKRAPPKPKSPNKTKRVQPPKNLPRRTKKQKLMDNVEPEQNHEEISSTTGVVKYEPTSAVDDLLDVDINKYSMQNSNAEVHPEEKEEGEIEGNSIIDLLPPQAVIEKTECTGLSPGTRVDGVPHEQAKNLQIAEPMFDIKQNSEELDEKKHTVPMRQLRVRPAVAEKSTRRASRRLQGNNSIVIKSEPDPSIISTPIDFQQSKRKKKSKETNIPFFAKIDGTNSSLADTFMLAHLNDFLSSTTNENKQENYGCLRNNEKFIREQLSLLMESEPLSTDVLAQVTENLLTINQPEVVATVMVDFAATEHLDDTKCNTTYTPPAPPMTTFEQKLVNLIMSIKEKQPDLVDAVNKGLEYKLFRLNKNIELLNVDRLFRILVVLNKIKKDREKVRMLISDALYCFNSRAMNIIHIALTCWSEVFPKHDANNDILVKTIVHVIMMANVNKPFSKVLPLKRLLTDYYEYPNSGFRVENFKQELMNNLKENVPGINTAILLLCKSKGPEWTLENIIKDLKGMIVDQAHPSMYDALNLLGNLLRPFSSENLKETLEKTTDQLCDVLAGGTGSHDLEEGIVSCLLSVGGKFAFIREKIAKHILQWQPSQDLRPTTKEKLDSFLKTHTPGWWRKFIRQNFPVTK